MVCPPLVSFLDDAEGDVGKQRRDHTTLGSVFVCRKQEAIRQNPGLQELRDQPRDLTIGDAGANPLLSGTSSYGWNVGPKSLGSRHGI